ncbi:hypothetical protein HUW46_09392 [Amycolatopsis sp. CA-230715]|nr:hypothetical protein HUW46_09392 [Amycolatopsis sp. CA-230715]
MQFGNHAANVAVRKARDYLRSVDADVSTLRPTEHQVQYERRLLGEVERLTEINKGLRVTWSEIPSGDRAAELVAEAIKAIDTWLARWQVAYEHGRDLADVMREHRELVGITRKIEEELSRLRGQTPLDPHV